jgi:predicted phage tail protein
MMTTVKLYGKLGKLFGRTWHLDVNSPREAVCAIDANRPGLAAYLTRNSLPGYHVIVGDRDRDEKELDLATAGRTIKIIPYVKGKSSGWAKVVIGAVLVVVGTLGEQPWMVNTGWSMLFGGVAQLLTTPPTLDQPNEREKSRPSYAFDGPVNTTAQGWPMPVGYGTLRIGGALVSMSIVASEVDSTGDDPLTGDFQIVMPLHNYAFLTECWGSVPIVYADVVEGIDPITWAITSQSNGNFFSIANTVGFPCRASITWGSAPPCVEHTLVIKATDTDLIHPENGQIATFTTTIYLIPVF